MNKEKYIKESEVIKAMENNSRIMEVFGTQRKMIDGMLLCYDISELEKVDIQEIRDKAIDEAITAAAKAICVGCGYLDGHECTYKGCNCGVSKPMLEVVVKALEKMKEGAE